MSTITILDLMGEAKLIYTEAFDPFVPMFAAVGIHLVTGLGVPRLIRFSNLRFFKERAVTGGQEGRRQVALETDH